MFHSFFIGAVSALNYENNCAVRPISTQEAITVLQKWSLEIQISSQFFDVTDDFVTTDTSENNNVQNINKISSWLSHKHKNTYKSVFVSLIDDNEKMMAFTEKKKTHVQVNGFLACPFIEYDTHLLARSNLALELLDLASTNDDNILFVFDV
jgi:hypothetical protein